jgi:3-hydroxybutyryl-CoA dehydrogenase/5-formyl-3-hydroxy-2-methylpyridine 4-carboxylate dehydrogenase
MGPGIAATLARAGLSVAAYDAKAQQRDKASEAIKTADGVLASLGVRTLGDGANVAIAGTLAECVRGADLVLETVPEDLDLKIAIFRDIEALVSGDCVLASDTSGIPISKIQAGLKSPGRVVGMHWSNPPHIIPMIEVIAGERTRPETTHWMCDLVRSVGHIPVTVKKDVAGFVENRVLYAIMRECLDLVEEGVIDPEDLDTCVSWGIGYKLAVVGPMALLDMAGLDIYQAVGSYLNKELSRREDVAPYIADRVAKGNLGIKSGSGVYDYSSEGIAKLRAERARKLVAVRKALTA